jgi:hypothetical protein
VYSGFGVVTGMEYVVGEVVEEVVEKGANSLARPELVTARVQRLELRMDSSEVIRDHVLLSCERASVLEGSEVRDL